MHLCCCRDSRHISSQVNACISDCCFPTCVGKHVQPSSAEGTLNPSRRRDPSSIGICHGSPGSAAILCAALLKIFGYPNCWQGKLVEGFVEGCCPSMTRCPCHSLHAGLCILRDACTVMTSDSAVGLAPSHGRISGLRLLLLVQAQTAGMGGGHRSGRWLQAHGLLPPP